AVEPQILMDLSSIIEDPNKALAGPVALIAEAMVVQLTWEQKNSPVQGSDGVATITSWVTSDGPKEAVPPEAVRGMESYFGTHSVDPALFVQWVLRESYLETTRSMMDYAHKVRFYNEQKKALREQLGA